MVDLETIYQRLQPRQKKFIQEYIKDNNGTEAVKRAGYSPNGAHVRSYNLLRHPVVSQAIQILNQDCQKKLSELKSLNAINKESILLGLANDITIADRVSDKIAGRLGQAKILGLTKDIQVNQVSVFSNITTKQSRVDDINYTDITTDTPKT